MLKRHTLAFTLLLAGPLTAAELDLSVEIPRLSVAEYHRPYVAAWIEQPDQKVAAHLAVWYDLKLKNQEGSKWLKDLRQWWRRGGRDLSVPVDGLTSATRNVGTHSLQWNEKQMPKGRLPAGNYILMVEAAREVGGRELVRLPFTWPAKQPQSLSAQGSSELGAITLNLKP